MNENQQEKLVLVDGEIMPEAEAFIDVNDRGHNFGDGVFEIVPVYNGRCFALLPHMNNLFDSVIAVKIPGVYMIEELVEFHESLLAATGLKDCEIYTQVTRGSGAYALSYPEQSIPHLTMYAVPVDREALAEKRAKGVNVITVEDVRWARCDINTLNRLPEVMAKQKAVIGNAFDSLFVRDGKITESTEASFFIYKDGILWTHPENNFIHKNITRRLLMERLSKDLDLQIIERAFDKDFALKADEAFLCGPRCEFMPVTKIDRSFVADGKVGELTQKLQDAYMAFVANDCPAKHEYQQAGAWSVIGGFGVGAAIAASGAADAAAAFYVYHWYFGAYDAGAHVAAGRPEDSTVVGVFAAADCLRAGAGAAAVSDSCNLAGQFYLCAACASV